MILIDDCGVAPSVVTSLPIQERSEGIHVWYRKGHVAAAVIFVQQSNGKLSTDTV